MRFGATRRGFESRPLRHDPRPVLIAAVALAGLLGACGLDPATTGSSGTPVATASATSSAGSQAPTPSAGEIARAAAASAFSTQLALVDATDRAKLLAEFQSAVGSRLDGLPARAADAELVRMLSIGLYRLDDDSLLRRLALETKATLALDVATCAALARGTAPFDTAASRLTGLVTPLSPTERVEAIRISIAAIAAEVSELREPRQLTARERSGVVGAIAKAASPADATRIHDLATRAAAGKTLSDDDTCWLFRVPYRAYDALADADRRLLSRYVLGPMSG